MAKNKSWREIYIKILLKGPDKAEYAYAAELIDDGYANGKYLKSNSVSGDSIAHLQWSGPNTRGREYLDDLQTKVRRSSWWFRLWSAVVVFASWAIGFFSEFFIQWFWHP